MSLTRRIRFPLAAIATLALALACLASPARAAVPFTFSGGSGTPLTITVPQAVTYSILFDSSNAPYFVLDGVGNIIPFPGSTPLTGTLTYSINGGSPLPLASASAGMISGLNSGNVTGDDLYFINTFTPVTTGDTITLNPGTLSTVGNVAAPAPAPGTYDTFVMDASAVRISTFGVIPEPTTLGVLAAASAALIRRGRRRRPH